MLTILSGHRVIAVEQYGAGPYGSMQLADLGGEVIKIENPADGGDISRRVGPFFLCGIRAKMGSQSGAERRNWCPVLPIWARPKIHHLGSFELCV